MKRKITVTEYDDDDNVIRETTVTDDQLGMGRRALLAGLFPSADCTCKPWLSVLPPPPCPVHGQSYAPRITYVSTANTGRPMP